MNIKYINFESNSSDRWVCAAYFKCGKWRIYQSSHYEIRNKKEAYKLIQEVSQEMYISIDRIKLVKPISVSFKEVKIK